MASSEVIRLVTRSHMLAISSIFLLSAEMIGVVGWCGDYAKEALHRPPFEPLSIP